MRTAVIVIDMLVDYFRNPPLRDVRAPLVAAINRLTASARSQGWPIIWIRQEFRSDLQDAFLAMRKKGIRITLEGTEGCQLLPELNRVAGDHELVKKRYSAFFGTDLHDLLLRLEIQRLVVAGINTHACVRMTVIDAYQRDLEVTILRECVASRDPEHHDISLRYLAENIADVQSLEDFLSGSST